MNDSLALRLYRRALQWFPKDFRREYGDEMLQTFRDGLHDATVQGRLPMFWLETAWDVFSSVRRERSAHRKEVAVSAPTYRYTDDSRLVFHYARIAHHDLRHGLEVDLEHVLLGIADANTATSQLLASLSCGGDQLRERIRALRPSQPDALASDEAPKISTSIRQAMATASRIARGRGDEATEPRHMLLAILEQPHSIGFKALEACVSVDELRARLA